jgi:hypothetical protein
MLKAMWMTEAWRNIVVTSRHQPPLWRSGASSQRLA